MYDLVLNVPPLSMRPYFTTLTGTGAVTYDSATYTLKDNAGAVLASGTVDGHDAPSSLSVRVWQSIDAQTTLSAGCSILDLLPYVDGADSINRHEQTSIILYVPGTVSRTLYPTGADVQRELTANGLIVANPTGAAQFIDIFGAALKGREMVEEVTGRRFLATSQTRTYPFPKSGRVLQLGADLVGSPTVTINGTGKTLNTDYVLIPLNADQDGKPFDRIEFAYQYLWTQTYPMSNPRPISVMGSFGFGLTIVEDAWRAMLDAACLECVPGIQAALTGGLVKWTEADVTEDYGKSAFAGSVEQWQARLMNTIKYRTNRKVGIPR